MKNINLAEKNGMWKGSRAKLDAIHVFVTKRFPKPKKCQHCLKIKRLDLANISQKYKREVSDWEWLCRRCHMISDGRLTQMVKRNKSRLLKKRRCDVCGHWFKPWNSKGRCCSLNCNAVIANRVRWGK